MEASLSVPTATSVRAIPAKLLIDNRVVINNFLRRSRGGKVSFTHLIGWALVQALKVMPEMNRSFTEVDGKPGVTEHDHVNLGLAIDMTKPDGTRQLLVPSIKSAELMDFGTFWASYEDLVRRARTSKLTVEDFQGTTVSLTNPGTIGTVHSVPRLMAGQGTIIGVGAMEYPAEYQGAAEETMARLAVSKTLTLTSTYDHRIIQGAQSGDFLRLVHQLLLGADDFYDGIFAALRIPYEPVRWSQDISVSHEDDVSKVARVQQLIHAYRVRGHLMADTDPLDYKQRRHPDLDIANHGLTLWDLDREFATGGFSGQPLAKLRDILGVLRDSYCRTVGIEYMLIQDPEQREWIQEQVEQDPKRCSREEQLRILRRLNAAEAFETFLQTKYVGQKRFSLEGGESVIVVLDAILGAAAQARLEEVCIGMPHRGRLNVLANIVGKSYGQIFREFEGNLDPSSAHGSGDVKYHLGADGTFTAEDGSATRVSLVSNPSHLEAVDPVLEGFVRAKQDMLDRGEEFPILPILMHGDAAFAGQGVVAETLELSQLRGYRTGGTVHVIVNNQVGFTTSPAASRSSTYATDVARTIQAPIFHVNGDDPEACRPGGPARLRVPPGVPQGRRHRRRVLPPSRAQRGGRPVADPAAHVQPDRQQAVGPQAVHRGADRPRRHHGRGGRDRAAGLPRPAGEGVPGDAGDGRRGLDQRPHQPGGARGAAAAEAAAAHRRDPHGDQRRGGQAGRRLPAEPAGGLHRPPAARAAAAASGRDGRAGRHRLGHGRGAGRRLAAHRGPGRAAGRPGLPAGHLRPPAHGHRRPGHGLGVQAAQAVLRQRRQALRLRLPAVGVRRHRIRVRLLGGPPRGAGHVGGPVRRLRQRRPDDRRRVHRLRRAEVEPAGLAWCCCSRTATRARGRTTRRRGSSGTCSCAPRTT